ncbi:ArsR/SmtB family transcription factor [Corynebacterium uterequi]|nr:metalloregulator ArsR/SmtB family transcription factor [Corynebacterium uterequi]
MSRSVPENLLALADTWSPLFKVLGDPTRLRLLLTMHYLGPGSASVSELAELTGLRTATTSAALKLMQQSGILTAERDGRQTFYSVANSEAHTLLHHIGGIHE